jgi:hypothetical protein
MTHTPLTITPTHGLVGGVDGVVVEGVEVVVGFGLGLHGVPW